MQRKFISPELLEQILSQDFQDRFFSHIAVKEANECWLWTASLCMGYGQIWVRCNKVKHRFHSHQIAWIISNKRVIPQDKWVLHSCPKQRDCCNPNHLRLGTRLENVADMHRQGCASNRKGENSATRKLTNEQVLKIRELYANGMRGHEAIGKLFSIGHTRVWEIISRKAWTHI